MVARFALPIRESTKASVFSAIASSRGFAILEVWLSCIRDLDMVFVDRLITPHARRLLLVLRPPQGHHTEITNSVKINILTRAGKAHVLVDLDSQTEEKELRFLAGHPSWPKIVSHHDMQKTPSDRTLARMIRDMERWQPTIYKIATLCRTPEDSVRLLQLLLVMQAKRKRCIILGMGPLGTPTRIFGTLWGNDMIFAPQDKLKKSAPGQLTKGQLELILNALKGA